MDHVLPVCYDICKLQTSFRFTTHTYVRAHMCRLTRDHIESALITFDPEHIDLYTLHVPDNPVPALLSRLISNQIVLTPTSLQVSSRQTHNWCRQLRYKAIVNATRNVIRLPSVDTQAMINNLLPSRCASRLGFGLPLLADVRMMINDLSHPRPIPRLGFGPHSCHPRAPTAYQSQPGPHTRRLIAHRSFCDSISSMHRRYVVENSPDDSSIDERDVPPLGQRRLSLYEDSTDDEDDPPSLRERHMVDSDSDSDSPSSLIYRQLARRYGWYESSSDSSDGSSVPSLEHDSDDSIENVIRCLLPMVGGTPCNPKPIWFLEDEISYHETSSVSSSASSHTSSSSSDDSSLSGQGPFPFEFIDLLHLSVFDDQLQNHMLKNCLTWESTAALSLPDDSDCPSVDADSHECPVFSRSTQISDLDEDTAGSLNFSTHGSNAVRRWSEPRDFFMRSSRNDVPGRSTVTTAHAAAPSIYDTGEDQRKQYWQKKRKNAHTMTSTICPLVSVDRGLGIRFPPLPQQGRRGLRNTRAYANGTW